MSQDYGTPTPVRAYPPDAEADIDEGTHAYGAPGSYGNADPYAGQSTGVEAGGPQKPATEVAKDQAANVGGTAADATKHVADVASTEASNVAGEAVQQGKNLLSQTTAELKDQAATQQQRVASGIRAVSDELRSILDGQSPQPGVASDLVRQASQRASEVAGWLEQRDPGSLVQEVRDFARRRPGTFLAVAAGAGLVAGRLTRAASAAGQNPGGSSASVPAAGRPAPGRPAPGRPAPGGAGVTRTNGVSDVPGVAGAGEFPAAGEFTAPVTTGTQNWERP